MMNNQLSETLGLQFIWFQKSQKAQCIITVLIFDFGSEMIYSFCQYQQVLLLAQYLFLSQVQPEHYLANHDYTMMALDAFNIKYAMVKILEKFQIQVRWLFKLAIVKNKRKRISKLSQNNTENHELPIHSKLQFNWNECCFRNIINYEQRYLVQFEFREVYVRQFLPDDQKNIRHIDSGISSSLLSKIYQKLLIGIYSQKIIGIFEEKIQNSKEMIKFTFWHDLSIPHVQ